MQDKLTQGKLKSLCIFFNDSVFNDSQGGTGNYKQSDYN